MMLDLNLNGLKRELGKTKPKPKTILVQLPEGLKTRVTEIRTTLKGYDLFFSIEPVYGACDLQEHLAEKIKANVILHFGHSEYTPFKKPKVVYWPAGYVFDGRENAELVRGIEKIFEGKKVAFIYPVQYTNAVAEISKTLTKNKKVTVIEGKLNSRIKNKGQVLGCDISTILPVVGDVDYFLYIGDGYFHPSAAFNIAFDKKIYWVMPNKEITEIKPKDEELKRRQMLPFMIKERHVFAIFVSRKTGQHDLKMAEKIRELLEKNKKEVIMLIGDNISNEKILGMRVEVLVNTACPRISDDHKNYSVLVANPQDIFEAFEPKK